MDWRSIRDQKLINDRKLWAQYGASVSSITSADGDDDDDHDDDEKAITPVIR